MLLWTKLGNHKLGYQLTDHGVIYLDLRLQQQQQQQQHSNVQLTAAAVAYISLRLRCYRTHVVEFYTAR